MDTLLTIGALARRANVPVKTVRFYEDIGLLPAAERSEGGYRLFTLTDVRRLRLIRRAKLLGLSLQEIRELADLAFADSCQSFEVRLQTLIDRRLADVERTIAELQSLGDELRQLRTSLAAPAPCEGACRTDACDYCRFIDD